MTGFVPDPKDIEEPRKREAVGKSLGYMDLKAGMKMEDVTIDKVFIGSCTNSHITDLRSASKVLLPLGSSACVSTSVHAMVVPGTGEVKDQAEEEGLDVILNRAAFDWREAGSVAAAIHGRLVDVRKLAELGKDDDL